MGSPGFRRHLFTEGLHVVICLDPRASRGSRAHLPILAAGRRFRPPLPRRAAGLQARPPAPGPDRIRGERPRPQDRGRGHRGRPERAKKRGYQGSSLSCPHCHESARFVGYRPKTVASLIGAVALERAYYHCRHCGHGAVPWDDVLGLDRAAATPGLREVICIAGAVDSFAEAAAVVLRKMAGVRVGASTVQRTGEATGRAIGARLAAGETSGAARDWAWHKDAEGKTCASVSLDLTGPGMQGPGASAAEGRMTAVGMIYNPVPEDRDRWAEPRGRAPCFQARYGAGLGGQGALGGPLRGQAAPGGLGRAGRWIAVCDAGSGLEGLLEVNFPRVEAVILDFYHAAEHLGDLGRALHPTDEAARAGWYEGWCHRLKHEGGRAVLDALRRMEPDGRESVRRGAGGGAGGSADRGTHLEDPGTTCAGTGG